MKKTAESCHYSINCGINVNTSAETAGIPEQSVIDEIRSDLAKTENDQNHEVMTIRQDVKLFYFFFAFGFILLSVEEDLTLGDEKQAKIIFLNLKLGSATKTIFEKFTLEIYITRKLSFSAF